MTLKPEKKSMTRKRSPVISKRTPKYDEIDFSQSRYMGVIKNVEFHDNEVLITGDLDQDGVAKLKKVYWGNEGTITMRDLKSTISIHSHFVESEYHWKDTLKRKAEPKVAEYFYDRKEFFLNPSAADVYVWARSFNSNNPQTFGIFANANDTVYLRTFQMKQMAKREREKLMEISHKYAVILSVARDKRDDRELYKETYAYRTHPLVMKFLSTATTQEVY